MSKLHIMKRYVKYLGFALVIFIGLLVYNNRGGYFVVEICDEQGTNCYTKEAMVDPEWASNKKVSYVSNGTGRFGERVITFTCESYGTLGGCRMDNTDFLDTITKIQRL